MKPIFCKECGDVVRLVKDLRTCQCGKSQGRYVDDLNAVIGGPCVPLGISNTSLTDAILARPYEGLGKEFTAFVIPIECETVKKIIRLS